MNFLEMTQVEFKEMVSNPPDDVDVINFDSNEDGIKMVEVTYIDGRRKFFVIKVK